MEYKNYCISDELTVREAMKAIDNADPKIVFIVRETKLIASLTLIITHDFNFFNKKSSFFCYLVNIDNFSGVFLRVLPKL